MAFVIVALVLLVFVRPITAAQVRRARELGERVRRAQTGTELR